MKSFAFFCLAFSTANVLGFAPQADSRTKHGSSLSIASTDQIIALSERSPALPFLLRPQKCKGYVGDVGFDPFGFSNKWHMEYLREAELKHGRVCMLAWTGWVAVDMGMRVYPTPEGWADLNSVTAHNALVTTDPSNPQGFWASPLANLLYAIAILEIYQMKNVNQMMREGTSSRAAGDLGWDVLGFLKDKSEEEANRVKLAELKHARLGMFAFSGVVAQNYLEGSPFPYFPEGL